MALLEGVALGAALSLAPGPLLALTVTTALRSGARSAVAVASAPVVTDAPVIAVALLATGLLSDEVLRGLTYAGAVVLLWLAVESWRGAGSAAEAPGERTGGALGRAALVNLVSPHPWLFWATVGAPIVVRAWRDAPLSAVGFVVGFYLLLVGGKAAVGVAVARARSRLRPAQVTIMTRVGAVLLVATAVALVVSG